MFISHWDFSRYGSGCSLWVAIKTNWSPLSTGRACCQSNHAVSILSIRYGRRFGCDDDRFHRDCTVGERLENLSHKPISVWLIHYGKQENFGGGLGHDGLRSSPWKPVCWSSSIADWQMVVVAIISDDPGLRLLISDPEIAHRWWHFGAKANGLREKCVSK